MEELTAEQAGTAEYSEMEEVTRFDHDGDTFVLFLLSKPSAGHSEGFGQDQGRKKKEIKRAAKKKLKAAAKTKGTNDAGFLAPTSGAYVAPLESTAASSTSASRQAPALQEAEAEHDEVYPSLQRSLPEHEVGDKLQASFQGVYQLDEDTRVPRTPVADEAAGHHHRMRLCSVPSAIDIVTPSCSSSVDPKQTMIIRGRGSVFTGMASAAQPARSASTPPRPSESEEYKRKVAP